MPAFRAIYILKRSLVLRTKHVNFFSVPAFRPPQSQHPGWCMADTPHVTVYPVYTGEWNVSNQCFGFVFNIYYRDQSVRIAHYALIDFNRIDQCPDHNSMLVFRCSDCNWDLTCLDM